MNKILNKTNLGLFTFSKNTLLFLFLTVIIQNISAQDLLSLEEAKSIATGNSYNVKISESSVKISQVNTQLIGAGKKTTFGLNSGVNGNLSNSILKLSTRPEATQTWFAPSIGANVGAAANYLLYDAGNINNQVKQNIEKERLANLSLNATKQEIVYNVESAYLNVARLYERISLFQESIEISAQRRLRAQYNFDFGSADKLALLNAEVDLNRDSVDLLKFEQEIINAKRNLNLILNRDYQIDFSVEADIEIDPSLTLASFLDIAFENNLDLKQAEQNLNISAYDKRINDTQLKPSVTANASYGINFQKTTDKNAIVDYNLNDGLQLGLTATWTLSDGGRTNILNELAVLRRDQEKIRINQTKDQIVLQITNAWGLYENALLVFRLEQKNVSLAEENFSRTETKFKDGQVNSITFRQAQLNLLQAKLNLTFAKYDAKLIELDLRQLSGVLL